MTTERNPKIGELESVSEETLERIDHVPGPARTVRFPASRRT